MSESEIREAIAAQEEHIKRSSSCRGRLYVSHRWIVRDDHPLQEPWFECESCGVTKTSGDYERKVAASHG